MTFWLAFSGFLSGFSVVGRATGIPFWRRGVTTMKMIRSTRHTSTSGVTLMSLWSLSRLLPPPMPMVGRLLGGAHGRCLLGAPPLDEVVEQLGSRVGHLDLETLNLVHENVEEPHGRDRYEETQRRRDQGLRDAGRNGRDAAGSAHGHPAKGVDDADDRAEEADER